MPSNTEIDEEVKVCNKIALDLFDDLLEKIGLTDSDPVGVVYSLVTYLVAYMAEAGFTPDELAKIAKTFAELHLNDEL